MCKGLMHDTVDMKVACEGKEMGELLGILHEEFDKSGAQISVCVCGVCVCVRLTMGQSHVLSLRNCLI